MKNYLIPVIPFHDQILSRGEGSYVYDIKGKRYLDLNSGQFCSIIGHSNEELVKCVTNLSETLVHTSSGMISDIAIEAAEKLNCISGKMDARSITLSTGAEAVEFAIRYAKHITNKEGVICFSKGYHGLTLGTQSITFGGKYTSPHIDNIYSVQIPQEDDYGVCVDAFKDVINKHKDNIAAVVMEPIVSVGGMLFPNDEYFRQISTICHDTGILLVFDESQTGFGRTGRWFCFEHFDVIPDMVVCSKGIGMGFPVSAVLFSNNLCEKSTITMTHYSSHQNDPFAARIISFGIDYIGNNNLLESNIEKGEYFLEKLHSLCEFNTMYRNPRGRGLMLGVDFFIEGIDNYRPIYAKVYDEAASKGLLIQGTDGGRVLRFLPDYLISKDDIDFCINILGGIHL